MTVIEAARHPSRAAAARTVDGPMRRAASWIAEPVAQLLLMLAAALTYFGVRGITETGRDTAVAHAHNVVTFERHFGFDVEAWLQARTVDHHAIVTLVNWIYIWGHWPVIIATLVWLHREHRDTYRLLRNAMFISGAIGLVVFATYPVAPPRLAELGFVDTVTEHSNSYRVLQPPALVNKYAALPSLHVGWNFLVGVIVSDRVSRRWLRRIALLSPLLMYTAVVLTGNHYIIDGIVGTAVAAIGLALARRLGRSQIEAPRPSYRRWRSVPARQAAGFST
jgi:hypothetical protein